MGFRVQGLGARLQHRGIHGRRGGRRLARDSRCSLREVRGYSAHVRKSRQARPESCLGFQIKVVKPCSVAPSLPGGRVRSGGEAAPRRLARASRRSLREGGLCYCQGVDNLSDLSANYRLGDDNYSDLSAYSRLGGDRSGNDISPQGSLRVYSMASGPPAKPSRGYRGTSLIRNSPPPLGSPRHRATVGSYWGGCFL